MTKVIFMGTPAFSVTVLDGLVKAGYEVLAVVTQPDKKVGRKQVLTSSPVKEYASLHNLPVYQPVKLTGSEEVQHLIDLNADLIITAAYGQFLPTVFLESAKIAAVNVHGSLLPKYRGGAPIQYALKNGDAETGITIMEMVKEMDAGDMYAAKAIKIDQDDNLGSLFEKLSIIGRDLLLETLPAIIDGTAKKTKQVEEQVTFSPNIKRTEEQIMLSMTAVQANNLVRALNPDPVAYMIFNGERLKVYETEVVNTSTSLAPGFLVNNQKELTISMNKQSILRLLVVQPVGGKKMTAKDFLNGRGKNLTIGEQVVTDD